MPSSESNSPLGLLSEEEMNARQESLPDAKKLDRLAAFYRVMGDPSRLKILISLLEEELCASDLARISGLSRSAASHALRVLRDAKLVRSCKRGQTVFYALDDEHIHDVLSVAFTHIQEED